MIEEQIDLIPNEGDAEGTTEAAPEVDTKLVELQGRYERLAPLEGYVEALGADKVTELASLGYQVRQNPELVQLINDHLSGKSRSAAPAEPESPEFYDPEVKALNDRVNPEIEQLKRMNADLQERVLRAETTQFKENVTSNISKVLEKFKDDDELFKESHDALTKAMNSASPAQLEQLGTEQGIKTLKMMLIDQHEKFYERKLAAKPKAAEPTEASVLSKATDARHQTRAALPANTVSVKSGMKITPQTTREIMEQVTAKFGKDPKSFWN